MASQHFTKELKEALLCPICIDILQDPVTLDCGHNFCLRCISQVAEETLSKFFKCPLCGKSVRKNFEPNWLLVNLVEKLQAMGPFEMPTEKEEDRCKNHKEKLHYFCDHDGKLLCMLCRDTKEHKSHNVLLIEEAAPRYQEKLQSQVEVLKQKETVIKQAKQQGEQKINKFMAEVELEKEKITREFQQLYQALKEEENFLLSRINWLAQEGASGKNVYVTASETQLNSLRDFIDSLMARQHFTPKQMLQNIKITLCRSEGFPFLSPTPVPSHLERKLSDAQSRHKLLASCLKKFKGHLKNEGEKDRSKFLKGMSDKDIMKYLDGQSGPDNPKTNKTSEPESPSPVQDPDTQPLGLPVLWSSKGTSDSAGSAARSPPVPPRHLSAPQSPQLRPRPPPIPPRGKASLAGPPPSPALRPPAEAATPNAWSPAELKEALRIHIENDQSSGSLSLNIPSASSESCFRWEKQEPQEPKWKEIISALVPVTFDKATAHPDLIISPDLKTAALDFMPHESSDEPTDPKCFYPFRCVLGFPGLSRGRHTWETQLEGPGGGACMVGVALGQAARRGFLMIEPLTGFWVLRITGSECQALLEAGAREDLPARPRKVGICVDFECGEVVFYDAVTNKHIYTFHTSFPGHVFPFYRLLFAGTRITLNP